MGNRFNSQVSVMKSNPRTASNAGPPLLSFDQDFVPLADLHGADTDATDAVARREA